LIFYQFFLILHLSNLIEQRFMNIQNGDKGFSFGFSSLPSMRQKFKYVFLYILMGFWNNISFLVVIVTSYMQINDLYLSYEIVAVLICPIKTWLLILAFYLNYKCSHLSVNDFSNILNVNSSKNRTIVDNNRLQHLNRE
jgi:hypothetical protein